MKRRRIIFLLCLLLLAVAGVGGFVVGSKTARRQAEIEGLVSNASSVAYELGYLRANGYSDTKHLRELEVNLDLLLMSVGERAPYAALRSVEQNWLQDIKRYRTKYPYDVPADFVAGMVAARLVHPHADKFLKSFTQEPERMRVY